MGKTARLPDPVYRKAKQQAENQDVSIGTVIRDWMTKAEQFDQIEGLR